MDLEFKLQQAAYGWWILKLKWEKTVERTDLQTGNQKTEYRWCFYILKWLRKNNCIFRLCQLTSKVQYMCLAF